jgi:hypothetical protein
VPRDHHAVVSLLLDSREIATWTLRSEGAPDLALVDEIARLHLTARQLGLSISLSHASNDLRQLLAFVGLDELID